MNPLIKKTLGLMAAACVSFAQAEVIPANFGNSLDDLLQWAETRSPMLNAMRFETEARQQRVIMAGALEDPMFKAEWMGIDKNRPSLAPARVGEMQYTLSQSLPLWGKRELGAQAAQASARAANLSAQDTRAQLRAAIRESYAQWYQALESLRINREQASLLQQMEASASQRYAVGRTSQAEALRLQMEISMLANEALQLKNSSEQARAALASWLNISPIELRGEPQSLLMPTATADENAWLQAAQADNPALAAQRSNADAARLLLDLSRRNSLPGINIGLSARQMDNKLTSYGLMLEFSIPLQQGAKRAEQSEALAMLQKARADEENRLRMIEREVHQMHAMLATAKQQIALLDHTLLPQAQLTLQSALASYSAGRGEFNTLLEAQQQIRKLRQMHIMAQYDAFQANSRLQQMTGE